MSFAQLHATTVIVMFLSTIKRSSKTKLMKQPVWKQSTCRFLNLELTVAIIIVLIKFTKQSMFHYLCQGIHFIIGVKGENMCWVDSVTIRVVINISFFIG